MRMTLRAALLVGALAAPTAGSADEGCRPFADAASATVAAVGPDHLLLADGRRVRLAGIEQPAALLGEHEERAHGEAFKRALADLVGRPVTTAVLGSADRHDRLPVLVWRPGEPAPVQAELLERGLARVRPLTGERTCLPALLRAETPARRARRGVWADPRYAVRRADEEALPGLTGQYLVIEGRVRSVGRTRIATYLNFGPDIRRDFSAMILDKAVAALRELGRDPAAFRGKRVRVRGVLETSRALRIVVAVPEQIETVDED